MVREINLNIKEAKTLQVIKYMQGDATNMTISCNIYDDDAAFNIDTDTFDVVVLQGKTEQNHMVSINSKVVSGNNVQFELSENENSVGNIKVCVQMSSSSQKKTLSTFPFVLAVTENPAFSAVTETDNLQSLVDYVDQAKQYADSTKDVHEEAVKVFESEKNAKASEDAAKTSETNAKASENAANLSATKAESSATNSSESAANSLNFSAVSQSYAVGGSAIRDGEDMDNAKYYAEQAKNNADVSKQNLDEVKEAKQDAIDAIDGKLNKNVAKFNVDLETGHLKYDGGISNFKVQENGHLIWEVAV